MYLTSVHASQHFETCMPVRHLNPRYLYRWTFDQICPFLSSWLYVSVMESFGLVLLFKLHKLYLYMISLSLSLCPLQSLSDLYLYGFIVAHFLVDDCIFRKITFREFYMCFLFQRERKSERLWELESATILQLSRVGHLSLSCLISYRWLEPKRPGDGTRMLLKHLRLS